MDRRFDQVDNYKLDCGWLLGKERSIRMFQDKDQCIFDLHKLDLMDILDL